MPRQRQPDISYIIGDEGGFRRFIEGLRNTVADHPPRREDVLDNLDPSKRNHPVMVSKDSYEKQPRWLEIKLQVAGEETSTTLAVRADSLKVIGFMNQNGNWYGIPRWRGLPHNYKAQLLDWDPSWLGNYKNILDAGNEEEVVKILDSARLGKTFAADAVRVLSRYPDVADGDNSRLALVGLSVMVCESARMKRLHDAIAGDWDTGASFTMQLLDYIKNWERISRALLVWKDHSYEAWIKDELLEMIGIKSPEEALDVVHLVCRVLIWEGELQRRVYTYDSF
jgi:hypothetical protein